MARVSDQEPTPRWHQRRVVKTSAQGVQIVAPQAVTAPLHLLEREADHEVQAIVDRSPRKASDPAFFEDVVKLAVELTRERTGNRQRERDAEEVLREPSRAARGSRRNLVLTVVMAAASIAGAIDHRIARTPADHPAADHAAADVVRTPQLEQQQSDKRLEENRAALQHEIDRLDQELRAIREQLGRHSELEPLVSAGAAPALVSTQGTNP